MSIVLKTKPEVLAEKYGAGLTGSREDFAHDAIAAHAMQMAVEEGKGEARNASDPLVTADWLAAIDWIERRAAANLARLMGEGNG